MDGPGMDRIKTPQQLTREHKAVGCAMSTKNGRPFGIVLREQPGVI